MGKRKERRLAALSAAGRRVKLDLFAEPSGDLGGSSAHDQVGGDLDQSYRDGVPNSPSTSGQRQENPLLLLGQYSDDELEDESNEKDTNDVTENSLIEDNGQVKEAADTESGVLENNTGKDVAAQLVMVEDVEKDATHSNAASNLDDAEIRGSDATASGEPHNQADAAAQVSDPGSSGVQIIGEVVSGWKIVMHEESGRYYYWNTETGETSWEPPDVLAQGSEITTELNTPHITEEKENPSRDTHASSPIFHLNVSAINEPEGSILAPETQENCENGFHEKKWNGHRVESQDVLNLSFNTEQIESTESSVTLNVLHQQALSLGDYVSVQQSNSALSSTICSATTAHDDKDEKPTVVSEQHESAVALSSSLVKYGESLIKRLTSLEGYNNHDQRYDWISKYTMEVEIRLADIKSLLAYGSLLLPFWVHCEAQFKRLDCAINDQVLQIDKSEQLNKVEHHPVSSFGGDGISLQSMGRESEVGEKDQVLTSANETQYISPDVDKVNLVHREAHGRHSSVDNTNTNHALSSGLPTELSKEVEEKLQKVNETALPDAFISKNATRIGEDIDMDVEMEVDEAPANSMTGDSLVTKVFPPLEQQNQTTPPSVECPTIEPGNEIAAPPPPDEEWIPPPPPDAEPLPPPPPDEPLPSYPPPPPYSETVPSLSYAEQYNLGYSVSNFNYYGATMTEVPMANYYAHGETHQLAEPQPVQYHDTVQNTYPEAAPAMVNPVPTEPVMYYDLPNGPMPPVTVITSSESGFYNESGPVVSSMESSGLYCESGSVSYHDTAASVQMGSVETLAESGSSSLPSSKVEPDFSTKSVSAQVLSKQPAVESMTTVVCEGAPATAASTAAPAASKAQSKALRGKKRTIAVAPTLRSNKKVSSLVDKWKAVKEELHEDEEDEPEYAYEILEKKRQKEIVQWRAQQIASGEAKDNANFQPLGGDWRERVKRKRAQLTNDSVQAQSEIPANEKQQPDLVELSKDLPSGWQAYWDDSSKEVYYGNVLTSETTWTRPT